MTAAGLGRRFKVKLFLLGCLWSGHAYAASLPPLVGCPANGQSGPVPTLTISPARPRLSGADAEQLALYGAEGLSVLAPHGWHCIEMYGSGGALLLVTPRAYTTDTLPDFNSLTGPAIELSLISGENSGRDQVAEVFSRLFPSKRQFVRAVAENLDVPRHYPHGPFVGDQTVRRGSVRVDYTTPPHHNGMGTYASRLAPGNDPIGGTALLAQVQGVDSVILLNVRLPPVMHALSAVIIHAAAVQMGQNPKTLR